MSTASSTSANRRRSLMKRSRLKQVVMALLVTALLTHSDRAAFAQASSPHSITLYEDTKTGALYRKPGRGRVAVTLGFDEPSPPPAAVQPQVEEVKKSNEELRAEFLANQQTL